MPAAQVDHAEHEDWFALEVYVPAAHGAHVRSVVVEPDVRMYVPAAHVVMLAHDVCPVLGW